MRPVVRALAAACVAAAGLVLAVPPVQASVQHAQRSSSGTYPAASRALTISIDAVTPQWATPANPTVTVSGTLSNHTGSALSGIVVQAQTSYQYFGYRTAMTSFASTGSFPYALVPAGSPDTVAAQVRNGATVRWSVSFDAAAYYSGAFGYGGTSMEVYPVQVQASAVGYQASARTFLPYWPGQGAATPLQIAWVWPLIDTPQQGACPRTLATPELGSSLAQGGRLGRLLSAGLEWSAQDHLTWAVDPALLSDATVMSRPYFTGGNSGCTGRTRHGASAAAAGWLAALRAGTAGAPAFLTPYANVDVAALSHAGLGPSVRSAYQLGRKVAAQILPATFGPAGEGGGDGAVLPAAWPAGGTADAGVLATLAGEGGIRVAVLKSGELPSSTRYDDALARTTAGGAPVSVLLADSDLTSLLGSATAGSPAAARFAVTQGFLAQTAMIVAEGPNSGRTLVVAPPPGWAPSQGEAATLLSMTAGAPWLSPTGLGSLAAEAAKVPATALPRKKVSHAELRAPYLSQVRAAQANLGLFKHLLYRPSAGLVASLGEALAATESSAWRGTGSPGGWLAVTRLADFLRDEENKVQIIASKKILLTGTSGTTPVSVQNGLGLAVLVRVRAFTPPGSQLRVGSFDSVLKVAAGKTGTVRMPVHSQAIGTTTMKLQLATANGTPLTWTAQPLSVEVTRFGRALLLVIGGALGVLVLTVAVRLKRRRRGASGYGSSADGDAQAGGAG